MKIWTINTNLEDKKISLNDNEARVINLEEKSVVYGSFILTKGRSTSWKIEDLNLTKKF